jgi:hypothetical protein
MDIKAYRAAMGPGVGHPPRPARCEFCDAARIWFDGWRSVFCVVLADGRPYRFDDGLPLQRVVCAGCGISWTLRPAFLYAHRTFAPDVPEAAALAYLADPAATYVKVAQQFGCSWTALWGWVSWLAALIPPAALLAEIARLNATTPAAAMIPHAVPQHHPKARSAPRQAVLLRAYQTLVALTLFARAQLVPPTDPSPLRLVLLARFLAFRTHAFLRRPGFSPAFHIAARASPG